MKQNEPSKNELFSLKKFKWGRYAVLIAVVINLIFFALFHQSALEEFKQAGEALTNEASQSLKIWVGEQRKISSLISVSDPIQNWMSHSNDQGAEQEAYRYLRGVVSRFNQYESIRVDLLQDSKKPWKIDNTNNKLLDSKFIIVGETGNKVFSEDEWLEEVLSGKSYYISSIFKSEDTNKPVFYYSIPIIRNNQVQALLTFKVKMNYYTELVFQNIGYKNTGYLFMIDERGETIAHINPNYVLSDEQYLISIVNRILMPLKLGDGFFSGKLQGVKKFYFGIESGISTDHLEDRWYIVFTENEAEVYTQSSRFLVVMLISTGILLWVLNVSYRKLSDYKNEFYEESMERLKREQLEEQLALKRNEIVRQINLDQLTGVGHFQTIMRVLEQSIEQAKIGSEETTLSLIFCKVDAFRSFNEREGYALGDILLNYLGRSLNEFYEEPCQVGRIYGDIFAIVLPNKTLIESVVSAEHFREKYNKKVLALIPHKPTISFGIVQWSGENLNAFLTKAEQTLDKCKEEGPGQTKY